MKGEEKPASWQRRATRVLRRRQLPLKYDLMHEEKGIYDITVAVGTSTERFDWINEFYRDVTISMGTWYWNTATTNKANEFLCI